MNNKFKIVQITSYYPPFLGGLGKVAEEVSLQLAENGNDVLVIATNLQAKKHNFKEKSKNIVIKRLKAVELFHVPIVPNLFFQLLIVPKPAIFHLHFSPALIPDIMWIVSKLRGIPYIVHFHLDVDPSGVFGFIFLWWKRWIQPIIIRDAKVVITLSPDQKKLIEDRYNKSPEQVRFLGNGVGDNFFKIGRERKYFNQELKILFVGRLEVQKRPERLIKALKLTKLKITLDMVGDGEDMEKMKALAKELKLNNINFIGRLSGEKLINAYRNADVFILPSDKEGMPLVLLEAMAAGLPIIGSDVLGINELIKGVGILVKDPNPENFARAIDDLAENPIRLKELSEKSFNKAHEYSWKKLVKKLEIVYSEILNS
jgi:glycosyltransferase involved in cell wall biosynthesis